MVSIRSLVLLCWLQCLVYATWDDPLEDAESPLAELEFDAGSLNTSNHDDIKIFIQNWGPSLVKHNNKQNIRQPAKPLLAAVQLPFSPAGRFRRQDTVTCGENGEYCDTNNICCGPRDGRWCCGISENGSECCQGVGGCCINGATCCGPAAGGPDSADCCFSGSTCCRPPGRKPNCCEGDQTCDNTNGGCINPTTTETETQTDWVTDTTTVTETTDGTTTQEWTETKRTTVETTVADTGTVTTTITKWETVTGEPPTTTNTDTESATNAAARRGLNGIIPPFPTATTNPDPILKPRSFIVRPGEHLDHLARVLQDRGVTIERRATETYTETETETATDWQTETEVETEWETETTTTTETDTVTNTRFESAERVVTEEVTSTTYVAEARPSDDDEDQSGGGGGDGSGNDNGNGDGNGNGNDDTNDNDNGGGGGSDDDLPVGTIAGAAAGGGVGLILIVLLGCLIYRRRKRNKDLDSRPVSQFQPQTPTPMMSGPTSPDRNTMISNNSSAFMGAGAGVGVGAGGAGGYPPWQHHEDDRYHGSRELGGSPPPKYPVYSQTQTPVSQELSGERMRSPVQEYPRYEMPGGRMEEPPQELYGHGYGQNYGR